MAMEDSRDETGQQKLIAEFGEQIERTRRNGVGSDQLDLGQSESVPSPGQIASGGSLDADEVITGQQLKSLFAEWEADYAARRAEDARPTPRPPAPGEIARDDRQSAAEAVPDPDRLHNGGRGR
jgi:hypothetical protein